MHLYEYTIIYYGELFTGEVEASSEDSAADLAELHAVDRIVDEFGGDWNYVMSDVEGTAKVEKKPVLFNMVTGEKTVGPAGMEPEILFTLMHQW